MTERSMTKLYAGTAAALVAALLGALLYFVMHGGPRDGDRFAQCRATNVAGGAGSIGGPFTLVDQTGRTVTDADVIQRPALIYFGYTFCPDVCPFDMARNIEAIELLAARGIRVTPVFISIDPRRDTPERLAEFARWLHDDVIALTGSEEQVRAASQAYRTYYRAHETDDEFYLVDHSTFTYLTLPGHGFVEFFRRETAPEQMADSIACFVRAAGPTGPV
jgi:protein SCO1/2